MITRRTPQKSTAALPAARQSGVKSAFANKPPHSKKVHTNGRLTRMLKWLSGHCFAMQVALEKPVKFWLPPTNSGPLLRRFVFLPKPSERADVAAVSLATRRSPVAADFHLATRFRFATHQEIGFGVTAREQTIGLIPVRNKLEGSARKSAEPFFASRERCEERTGKPIRIRPPSGANSQGEAASSLSAAGRPPHSKKTKGTPPARRAKRRLLAALQEKQQQISRSVHWRLLEMTSEGEAACAEASGGPMIFLRLSER